MNPQLATPSRLFVRHDRVLDPSNAIHRGTLLLLAIKDSDIRALTLEQCRDAVDKGLHAGGAFSATIPLVALYYGGYIDVDVADPTRRGQDLFVLSKGHAVAALASAARPTHRLGVRAEVTRSHQDGRRGGFRASPARCVEFSAAASAADGNHQCADR